MSVAGLADALPISAGRLWLFVLSRRADTLRDMPKEPSSYLPHLVAAVVLGVTSP